MRTIWFTNFHLYDVIAVVKNNVCGHTQTHTCTWYSDPFKNFDCKHCGLYINYYNNMRRFISLFVASALWSYSDLSTVIQFLDLLIWSIQFFLLLVQMNVSEWKQKKKYIVNNNLIENTMCWNWLRIIYKRLHFFNGNYFAYF